MKKGVPRSIPQPPTFAFDPGTKTDIVYVPLSGGSGKVAVLDRADFDNLAHLEMDKGWYWCSTPTRLGGVVRYNHSAIHKGLVVARLILQPQPHQSVRYRDGDALNLRRGNLWAAKGRKANNMERDALLSASRAAQARLEREAKLEGLTGVDRFLAGLEHDEDGYSPFHHTVPANTRYQG